MIALMNLTHSVGAGANRKIILDRVNLRIERTERIGILAPNGGGKTTIARLLIGMILPQQGQITRDHTLSWPLGFAGQFHPKLSGAENIETIAGLHGVDPTALIVDVAGFARMGEALFQPVEQLTPGHRARLAIGLSLSIRFDMYLADEISAVGTRDFQDAVAARLEKALERSGLILLTRHAHMLDRHATRFLALAGGQLIPCQTPNDAADLIEAHQEKEESQHVLV